ncbi:integral membrane protein [Colletotrichum sublineola]|uniref:Putative integral membrane protein n=1 Tax=Colletotrichum sublineola TaxID=1173701 RepID=A0A066XQJ0_COLSU|nr:integral membrane protein [Colletotrichum sublineola]KDN69964.1 putative integral membrane protein [Colletotrichum sublineola]
MAGETGTVSLSQAQAMVMVAFAATAYYNTIETFFSIFTTFKRRQGRYFWSMIVANTGININVIAFVLRYFGHYHEAVVASSFMIPFAWYAMVTGQAIVLWSRLHLVIHSQRKIRLILSMIIFNAVTMHIPETVIFVLANLKPQQWIFPFKTYEKVELVVFFLQETIIAAVFLYEGYKSLKPLSAIKPKAVTTMVRHLGALFAVVFILDTGLIILEYNDKFEVQTMCKPFVYSVKIKMEFVVLNKLLAFTRMSTCNCRGPETIPSNTLPDSKNRTTIGGNANNGATQPLPYVEQTGGSLSPIWHTIQEDHIFDGRASQISTRSRRQFKDNQAEATTAEAVPPPSPRTKA